MVSRYYDPETGRFINADDVSYIDPETVNGLNLYAYCGNNPVMYTDSAGCSWWDDFWNSTAGVIVGTILVVAAVVAITVLTAGVGTAITGALGGGFFASMLGGAVAGAISGAVIGAGISLVSQGISGGYGDINWAAVGNAALTGAISGAITGGVIGFAGAAVRGLKIVGAARKGLVIGKMGNFKEAAKAMNTNYYGGLKGYKLVEKIFGKNLASKIGWQHNKAFVQAVMKMEAPIIDLGGKLTGSYAKEIIFTQGYKYLLKLAELVF